MDADGRGYFELRLHREFSLVQHQVDIASHSQTDHKDFSDTQFLPSILRNNVTTDNSIRL